MYAVEAKVASWKRLYDELSAAQAALRSARDGHAGSVSVADLEAQVRGLQRSSDEALQALDAALAARNAHRSVHPA